MVYKAKRKATKIAKYRKEQVLRQDELNEFLEKALIGFKGDLDIGSDTIELLICDKEDSVIQINDNHYPLRFSMDYVLLMLESNITLYWMNEISILMLDTDFRTATTSVTMDVFSRASFMSSKWINILNNIGK